MTQDLDLKTNLKGNSSFEYYRDYAMWFRTETGMLFPVPVKDLDTCHILKTEKSMVFMKWIRKHIASQTEAMA
jgi:hypothetical protein